MNGASTAPFSARWNRWAWRLFRRWTERPRWDSGEADRLSAAGIRELPEEHSAMLLGSTVVAAVVGGVIGLSTLLLLSIPWGFTGAALVGLLTAVALPGGVYAYGALRPDWAAQDRRRRIDQDLRGALAYAAALGSADVPVDEILRGLAQEPEIYGEVTREAAGVLRDTDLLGHDILTALNDASRRSPSMKFQEFLQGVVATAESGGDFKEYLIDRAREYERESPARLSRAVESLSFVAEMYVVIVVAFPLFLLILLTVFSLLNGGSGLLVTVWLLVAVLVPMAQLGFIVGVGSLSAERSP